MTLKEVYEALAGLENGADLTKVLNTEINGLRVEAGDWRAKYSGVADKLGIKGKTDQDEALAGIVNALAALSANGGKPDEIGRQLTQLTEQVKQLTEKAAAEETRAKTEREKRIGETKLNKAIAALQNGKAANPAEIAKIVLASIQAKDDDSLVFKDGDKELSVDEGVANWLKTNQWAVSNTQQPGAGSQGGSGGAADPNEMNMEEYAKWYAERNK